MKPRRFMVIPILCACAFAEVHVPAPHVVGVYLDFENAPSPLSLERMKQETAAIMQPAGLELAWRDWLQSDAHESFPYLVVVHFRGTCEEPLNLYGTYAPEAQASALASTAVSDGHVLPFSEVACDEVRRYLAPVTRARRNGDGILGRALGRVMAHEMYHMLLSEPAHGKDGVARAYHRRDELLAANFRFSPREIERLRLLGSSTLLPK